MPSMIHSRRIDDRQAAGPVARRPVVLATLSVRFDPRAEQMAIESALDAHSPLIVANFMNIPNMPLTMMVAREHMTLPHEEDLEEVRATAQRAAEQGIETKLLRISSPRPLVAMVELVREERAGLLVLGPDQSRTPRLKLWRAARRVRRDTSCLVWIASEN